MHLNNENLCVYYLIIAKSNVVCVVSLSLSKNLHGDLLATTVRPKLQMFYNRSILFAKTTILPQKIMQTWCKGLSSNAWDDRPKNALSRQVFLLTDIRDEFCSSGKCIAFIQSICLTHEMIFWKMFFDKKVNILWIRNKRKSNMKTSTFLTKLFVITTFHVLFFILILFSWNTHAQKCNASEHVWINGF